MAFSLPLSSLLACPEPLLGLKPHQGWEHSQEPDRPASPQGPWSGEGRQRELGECSTGCWPGVSSWQL